MAGTVQDFHDDLSSTYNFMTQDLHLLVVYIYTYVLLKVTAAAVSAA